jgi:transposase-like protein
MNWLKGYGQPQPIPPIIRHQAAAEASQDRALAQVWLTGQNRRLVLIVCCPVCGSPGTAHDNGKSEGYRRWVCTSLTCKNAWKEKADLNTETVRTVV